MLLLKMSTESVQRPRLQKLFLPHRKKELDAKDDRPSAESLLCWIALLMLGKTTFTANSI